jgi:hypothetical protein
LGVGRILAGQRTSAAIAVRGPQKVDREISIRALRAWEVR